MPPLNASSDGWSDEIQGLTTWSEKNWTATLVLSIAFGAFGADRYYIGRFISGTIKMFIVGTGGIWLLCAVAGAAPPELGVGPGIIPGIWWLIDIVLVWSGRMKDADGKIIRRNA